VSTAVVFVNVRDSLDKERFLEHSRRCEGPQGTCVLVVLPRGCGSLRCS